jgi:hypothetical protein
MLTLPIQTPAEEYKGVVEVGIVRLDRDVVYPGLDAVEEPFRIDGRFEDERVGCDQAFEPGGPGIAIDLQAYN